MDTEQDYYGRSIYRRTPDGYRTRTQWAKCGRVPCADATAIVIIESVVLQGLSATAERLKEVYTPVVADLGNNRWLVAKPNEGKTINWWLVYREDQTRPKVQASRVVQKPPVAEEESPVVIEDEFAFALDYFDSPLSSLNLLPSSPPSSLIRWQNHRNSNQHQDLMPLLTVSGNRAVNRGNRAYFPEGLDRSEWPEQYRDAMTWIVHLIYLRRILERLRQGRICPPQDHLPAGTPRSK